MKNIVNIHRASPQPVGTSAFPLWSFILFRQLKANSGLGYPEAWIRAISSHLSRSPVTFQKVPSNKQSVMLTSISYLSSWTVQALRTSEMGSSLVSLALPGTFPGNSNITCKFKARCGPTPITLALGTEGKG